MKLIFSQGNLSAEKKIGGSTNLTPEQTFKLGDP